MYIYKYANIYIHVYTYIHRCLLCVTQSLFSNGTIHYVCVYMCVCVKSGVHDVQVWFT